MSHNEEEDDDVNIVTATENFSVWRSEEEDEVIYHVQLGGITLHLASEEWEELVILFKAVS